MNDLSLLNAASETLAGAAAGNPNALLQLQERARSCGQYLENRAREGGDIGIASFDLVGFI